MALTFNRIFGTSGSSNGQFSNPSKLKVYGDKIYILDVNNIRIEVVDLQGNYVTQWAEAAQGADLDVADGYVYVAYPSSGYVYRYDLIGNGAGSFHPVFDETYYICAATNYLLCARVSDLIAVYDPGFNLLGQYSTSPIVNVKGLAFYNGEIYILGQNSGSYPEVVVMNPLNGSINRSFLIPQVVYSPYGIDVDSTGVYIAGFGNNKVYRYDINGTYLDYAQYGDGAAFYPSDVSLYKGEIFVANAPLDNILVYEEPAPPSITAFTIPQSYGSRTVPITAFTASNSPTGYLVNQASSPPAPNDLGWTANPPTNYVFGTVGLKWLYPWAKNGVGVSTDGDNNRKSVFVYDQVPPTVSEFEIPPTSDSLTVPITTFVLTGVYITGYIVTESSNAPDPNGQGWTPWPTLNYTFGSAGAKTLYAWGKNVYGVSSSLSAQVVVTLTPPTPFPSPPSGFKLEIYLEFDEKIGATGIYLADGTPWGYAEFENNTTRIYLADGTPWGYLEYDEKTDSTRIYLEDGTLRGYWVFDAKADTVEIYLADGTPWGRAAYDEKTNQTLVYKRKDIIGINDTVVGRLTAASPPDPYYLPDIYYSEDWNLVEVVVGQAITVVETSPDFKIWIDILDATDLVNPIFEGGGPITFTPQAGINYVIRASTYAEYQVGAYTLATVS